MSICGYSDFHPYECSHDEYCIHCTNGVSELHVPTECWLCCDGEPKTHTPKRWVDKEYHQRIHVRDFSHRKLKVKVNTMGVKSQQELSF